MKKVDIGTDFEKIICRIRITGQYLGVPFVYEDPEDYEGSQFIWTKDMDPSSYWWREGNMGCDCNRVRFLPENLRHHHGEKCGHEIKFIKIEPLEGDGLPILEFDEL